MKSKINGNRKRISKRKHSFPEIATISMQVMMSLLGADQLWGALRAPTFGGDGATIRPTSNGQPLGGTRGKWERPRIASPGPFLGCRQQSRQLPLVDAKARLPGGCACASTRNKQQADSGAHNHGLLQTLRSVVEARSKQEAIQKAQEAPIMRLCYQCSQGEPDEWSASGELDGVPFNLKAEIYDGS